MIAKRACDPCRHARCTIGFASARAAFRAILSAAAFAGGAVLLPAYIGWSPKEGSGVFDPIESLGLDYRFYALDDRLRIDMDSLRQAMDDRSVRMLLLIHYFGYIDPNYAAAVRLAREYGVFVLEDAAHAMLSDLVGGTCGRMGDACLYSFHKILPVDSGGAAVINDPASDLARCLRTDAPDPLPTSRFDLRAIAHPAAPIAAYCTVCSPNSRLKSSPCSDRQPAASSRKRTRC